MASRLKKYFLTIELGASGIDNCLLEFIFLFPPLVCSHSTSKAKLYLRLDALEGVSRGFMAAFIILLQIIFPKYSNQVLLLLGLLIMLRKFLSLGLI